MSRIIRVMAMTAGIAVLCGAGGALAQTASVDSAPSATAEARLAWAKRHVDLVCRPLEARGMFERATRCYNDVARLVGEPPKAQPARAEADRAEPAKPATAAAAKPAAAPVPAASPAPAARPIARPIRTAARAPAAAPRTARPVAVMASERPSLPLISPAAISGRCSGISCLQRYTLLGVGF